MCLFSEEATVLPPFSVILNTVTNFFFICAVVVHSACALTTIRSCSAPIVHFHGVTWNPKAIVQSRTEALVLDELLTVLGNIDETHQLRDVRSLVVYVTWIRSLWFISLHQRPDLAVVTNDSHANFVLVDHVTCDVTWLQPSFAARIDGTRSTFCIRIDPL